ncbi:hypothetical protein OG339_48755 (plasmid) [Streptosporangium sp. NBC_01495]|uniref:hypothetical protein n=1 Tax=Streptosporangium sp. NBC_01495 TaxID=2903899 RepID=UPI002E35E688|nr:hypothetical protein [Streptosporangium sp. NBC_01495]
MITLYQTNDDLLIIAEGDQAWSLGVPDGDHLTGGTFVRDAEALAEGDWEPTEADGQASTMLDDCTAVATWDAENGLCLLTSYDALGAAAKGYLGPQPKTFEILVSDGSEGEGGPAWMIVDDTDCLLTGIEWQDGEKINDAIARFVAVGALPEGAQVKRQEQMLNPYSWQPSNYEFRWHVSA